MKLISLALTIALHNAATDGITEQEQECLAQAVYHEAIGEPYLGKVAVAYVVLNRANAGFMEETTICGTIFARKQFPWAKPPLKDIPDKYKASIYRVVYSVLYGHVKDPTNGAKYFYNPELVTSKFHESLKHSVTIGRHKFYY